MSNKIRQYLIYSIIVLATISGALFAYDNLKNPSVSSPSSKDKDITSNNELVIPIPPGDETVKYELKTSKRNQVKGDEYSGVNLTYPQITSYRSPEIAKAINDNIFVQAQRCLTRMDEGRESLLETYSFRSNEIYTDEQLAKMSDTELYLNQPAFTQVSTSDFIYAKHDLFSFHQVLECTGSVRRIAQSFTYDLRTGGLLKFGEVFTGFTVYEDSKYKDAYDIENTVLLHVIVDEYKKEIEKGGQDWEYCKDEINDFHDMSFYLNENNSISFVNEFGPYSGPCDYEITVPLSKLKPFFKPDSPFNRIN
jgi:hypothetical protein